MLEFLSQPWPWYVAGPLIGLIVPLLLILDNQKFGISTSFRYVCAAVAPGKIGYLNYNWKKDTWKFVFAVGTLLGGFIAGVVLKNPEPVAISAKTVADMKALGITEFSTIMPLDIFSWSGLLSLEGFLLMVVGGFLVGFGARYADGCTSGHAIMGVSNFELPSMIAMVGFFIGGLISTHLLLPLVLG